MSLTIAERSVVHDTFTIERHLSAEPARVFGALADREKKQRWLLGGTERKAEDFEMDFRIGGKERARSVIGGGPYQGWNLTTESTYEDIVQNERVVMASSMMLGEQRISATLLTFELIPQDKGTRLVFTHQGAFFEGADGPKMRQEGWNKLLDKLASEIAE